MTVINVEKVTKTYRLYPSAGGRIFEALSRRPRHAICRALDGVSFDVSRGQTVGIIGRNGSGKSTLLRILAGIIDPTSGAFEVRGGRVAPLLELGAGFVPALTGIENIRLNGKLLGLTRQEVSARMDSILDFAELGDFAYQAVRTYSAGMLLRLGFAIAQSIEPEVLLVDEVLAVGDAAFSAKCLARIEEFRARGATVLLVTHSMADLGALCDRVIQLDRGRIAREGPTEEIIRAYLEDMKSQGASAGAPLWRVPIPQRTSTREITISSVELLGPEDKPVSILETGDSARVRICFRVRKPVQNPMFRLQIFRADGLFVHGTNTYRQGVQMGAVDRDACIEVRYEKVNLLEGQYFVSVGIYPDEFGKAMAERAYDSLDPALRFDVRSSRPDGAGVMAMPHRWEWPA